MDLYEALSPSAWLAAVAAVAAAVAAVAPALWRWVAHRRHMNLLADAIPGPQGLPVIGNCLELTGRPPEVFQKAMSLFKKYPGITRLWFGPKLYVFVWNPDDVQTVLTSDATRDHSPEYDFFLPWLGDGIFCSNGPKWEWHRRLIAPTFNYSILRAFVPVFARCAREMARRLERELPSRPSRALDPSDPDAAASKPFDIFDYVSLCTLDIIIETAMGVRLNNQRHDNPHFVKATKQMCDVVHQRHYKVWLRNDLLFWLSPLSRVQKRAVQVLHDTSALILRKKHLEQESKPGLENGKSSQKLLADAAGTDAPTLKLEDADIGARERLTFLDLLLREASATGDGRLTEFEVKEQIDSLMFGGHETTAATFSYLMILLGFHPEIQDRIVAELDEIFEGSDRPPEFADLLRMKYLERCLKETMRLYTIVPIMGRRVARDLQLKDYTVPGGATAVLVSMLVHRDPQVYPDPERFDPERFLPDAAAARHPFAYIPFSAGPRNCIGQKFAMLQMKVTVSTTLRRFRVLPASGGPDGARPRILPLVAELVSKPAGGFLVRLAPRPPRHAARPRPVE